MLDRLNQAVNCHIIASGGVASLLDIVSIYDLGLYGAIAGKSLYTGALDLRAAIIACHKISPPPPPPRQVGRRRPARGRAGPVLPQVPT